MKNKGVPVLFLSLLVISLFAVVILQTAMVSAGIYTDDGSGTLCVKEGKEDCPKGYQCEVIPDSEISNDYWRCVLASSGYSPSGSGTNTGNNRCQLDPKKDYTPGTTGTVFDATQLSSLTKVVDFDSDNIRAWVISWETGGSNSIDAVFVKYMLLLIIIIFVYSALGYANFPESVFLRGALSFVVGFLATFAISPNEIIGIMTSYTALGVTLGLFVPVFVLGAISLFTAATLNPWGIYMQKVLWYFYSIYLFLTTGGSLFATYALGTVDSNGATTGLFGSLSCYAVKFFSFFIKPTIVMDGGQRTILGMLFISSIVIYWVLARNNKLIINWGARMKTDSEAEVLKEQLKKQDIKRKAESDSLGGQNK